jgi:hypothetical protein
MATGKVDFTGVQSTMLVTLFLKGVGQQGKGIHSR